MRWRDESGATLITAAITLTLLMGAAAVAIDLASGWNERRQDQTSSDLAAVAGGLSFFSVQTNEDIVTNILETARSNLRDQYSGPNDPAWVAAWRACTDPDQLPTTISEPTAWNSIPGGNAGGELECISFSTDRLRVRLPDQETATTFGRIIGWNSLTTHADTVVNVEIGGSGFLPFAIVGDATPGEVCLDTGPSPDEPCDRNDRGSFGAILPPQWGETGLSQYCPANGNGVAGLAAAVANGVDHLVWTYPVSSWTDNFGDPDGGYSNNAILNSSVNVDLCNTTSGAVAEPADLSHDPPLPINGVVVDTGNSARAEIFDGLVSEETFSGNPSRLQQSGGMHYVTAMNGNEEWLLDSTPLWLWLRPVVAGTFDYDDMQAPAICHPDYITTTGGATTGFDRGLLMVDCLVAWEAGGYTQPLFIDADILDAPRFGVAPQFWTNDLGSGLSYAPVREFRPVYIAGVDLSSRNGAGFWYPNGADEPYDPICLDNQGMQKSPPNGCRPLSVDQTTAYLLPKGIWNADVADGLYPGVDEDSLIPLIYE